MFDLTNVKMFLLQTLMSVWETMAVMSIMEVVSRSVLIFLVDITVPVWMGSVHRQTIKAHVKVHTYNVHVKTSTNNTLTNERKLVYTVCLLQTLMSVWETMAVIRRVLTLLDLTTATVNVAFSSSITLSVMVRIE